jgi:hypothetical protein
LNTSRKTGWFSTCVPNETCTRNFKEKHIMLKIILLYIYGWLEKSYAANPKNYYAQAEVV